MWIDNEGPHVKPLLDGIKYHNSALVIWLYNSALVVPVTIVIEQWKKADAGHIETEVDATDSDKKRKKFVNTLCAFD